MQANIRVPTQSHLLSALFTHVTLLFCALGGIASLVSWLPSVLGYGVGCVDMAALGLKLSGCKALELAMLDSIFGAPAGLVGLVFYLSVGAIAFATETISGRCKIYISFIKSVSIGIAAAFTVYLVYFQFAVAKMICPLCMLSAFAVLCLFVLEVLRLRMCPKASLHHPADKPAMLSLAITAVAALAIIFISAVYVLREAKLQEGALISARDRVVVFRKWAQVQGNAKHPLQNRLSISLQPSQGLGVDTGPTLVVFLDPNCPHCQDAFDSFLTIATRFKEHASFYVVPHALWDSSLVQIQSLAIAPSADTYFEHWRLQFSQRRKGGLGEKQLIDIWKQQGYDDVDMPMKLIAAREAAIAQRALHRSLNINKTPIYFLDGRQLPDEDTSEYYLQKIVEKALGVLR